MEIGKRIKQRREQLGITVDEIAKRLGKHRATIYRYESEDIRTLPTDVLEPLSNVLHTTPAALMGWVDFDQDIPQNNKLTTIINSELTPEQEELFRLFRAASPEVRAAALTVLRLAEAANKLQDEEEEE